MCVQGTVASTASCLQLHKRAERVAVALMEKGRLNTGDHVALVYPPGETIMCFMLMSLHQHCINKSTTKPTSVVKMECYDE